MAISAGVESTVTATTATQKERNKKQTTHQAQKQLSKRLLSVCMANREGKEGWPISAVVRADWHAFTQNQVPEVEWGAEGSLRWVRWVGSLARGGWLAGWVPVAWWLARWLAWWLARWLAG